MLRFLLTILAPCLLTAQAPVIGVIDFYGNHKVPEQRIRKSLGIKEGDPLPPSKADVEEQLESDGEILRARLEAACCEAGKVILYVGVEERGAPHFEFRPPPELPAVIPSTVMETYERFLRAVQEAVRRGDTGEDLSLGHSLMSDRNCRTLQELFSGYAAVYLANLRDVLRNSADARHRAAAAYILGYSSKKTEVIEDLQYALRDSDDSVRANAMRALTAVSVFAQRNPRTGIRVQPTWFIEMLNSLLWSDRHRASASLVTITESRDPAVLETLRERALPALAQMALWKHLEHALPAYILVGRVEGLTEAEIQRSWAAGEREKVVAEALKPADRR